MLPSAQSSRSGFNFMHTAYKHALLQLIALRFSKPWFSLAKNVLPFCRLPLGCGPARDGINSQLIGLHLRSVSTHRQALQPTSGHKELQESPPQIPWHVPLSIPLPQFSQTLWNLEQGQFWSEKRSSFRSEKYGRNWQNCGHGTDSSMSICFISASVRMSRMWSSAFASMCSLDKRFTCSLELNQYIVKDTLTPRGTHTHTRQGGNASEPKSSDSNGAAGSQCTSQLPAL